MRKLLIFVVLIVAAVVGFRYWDARHVVDRDRERVEDLLAAMRDNDEQAAVCLWALDKRIVDLETVKAYYDRYLRFVDATGMRIGTAWRVVDVARNDDAHETVVTVTGEDRRIALVVRPYVPIEARL